ncbi:MAG: rod-binding protein [Treponema sp.]|nr:rod-binding protein [Treponema sp.]
MTISSVNNASLLNGSETMHKAQFASEQNKFDSLITRIKNDAFTGDGIISSSQIAKDGKLNGDIATGFDGAFTTASDARALPLGAAANQAPVHGQTQTIDKTSKLYEKALELESYIVKIMLSSMRNTVAKSSLLGGDSFATKMYEDMMYDEYAATLTKNAGFGLADQVYLQLNTQA